MPRSRPISTLRTAGLALAMVLLLGGIAAACPTCKDAIAQNDPQHQAMVRGYFYSILFMMSMPFIVVGTFGGMAYYTVKRARRDSPEREA